MGLDGGDADGELGRNLGVGEPLGDGAGDASLTVGELVESVLVGPWARRQSGGGVDQVGEGGLGKDRVSRRHLADGVDEFAGRSVLQ